MRQMAGVLLTGGASRRMGRDKARLVVNGETLATRSARVLAAAVAFVVRIGFFAEHADHHPDLDVRWKRVRVALTTHDAGGLTAKDIDLAREIQGIGL